MAVARFQVVRAVRAVHVPVPREPGPDAGAAAPRATGFAWRFLSANNRSLARSVRTCPDVASCLAAIRILQESLPRAVGETARNGNGQWVWRVRVAGEVVATTTRTYPRQVRARLRCDSFLELVAETVASAPVQVISR
jgi:hypothetical protein